ncbi:MAG: hypothetical protein IKN80_05430 [Clostridiales bacterium]|nr:hypothetical protein [Clostridiales bacterium]
MRSQQDWVKDLMYLFVTTMGNCNGDMLDVGYSYTINAAIDNYSLIYRVNDKNINLFQQRYVKAFRNEYYKNIILSKDAYEQLKEVGDSNEDLKRVLHGEHLTPNSYIRRQLNDILVSDDWHKDNMDNRIKDRIELLFSNSKICIITKREKSFLDQAGRKYTQQDIDSFLKYIKEKGITLREGAEDLYKNLVNEYTKTSGLGTIRLYLLMIKESVPFVDSEGKPMEYEAAYKWLTDGDYSA